MYTKVGLTRLLLPLPIFYRDNEVEELVNAQAALTLQNSDFSFIKLNREKIKEGISRFFKIDDGEKLFLEDLSSRYSAERVFLNIRFNFVYSRTGEEDDKKVYPISLDYEYAKGKLASRVLNVVVLEYDKKVPKPQGYIIDFRLDIKENFVWYEDVIECIEELLEGKENDFERDSSKIIKEVVDAFRDSTNWYNVLVMQDTNIAVSERKI